MSDYQPAVERLYMRKTTSPPGEDGKEVPIKSLTTAVIMLRNIYVLQDGKEFNMSHESFPFALYPIVTPS